LDTRQRSRKIIATERRIAGAGVTLALLIVLLGPCVARVNLRSRPFGSFAASTRALRRRNVRSYRSAS
jgi:hypothetical protein